jgi:hypothetical protein
MEAEHSQYLFLKRGHGRSKKREINFLSSTIYKSNNEMTSTGISKRSVE